MKYSLVLILLFGSSSLFGQLTAYTDTCNVNIITYNPPRTYDTIQVCTTAIGIQQNSLKTGTWNFYQCSYCDSAKLYATVNFLNGEFEGEYHSYRKNGSLKSTFIFKKGNLVGAFKCYSEKNTLIYDGKISEDSKTAQGKEFFDSGSFKRNRNFNPQTLRKNFLEEIK